MIDFKAFITKPLTENSLYTNPTEKADLLKNKTKLYDSFYLNFLGFVGMFSIHTLAPLKKYEETEGKLFIDNIGDTNHDVSLSIKLMYDQKLIQRSVVDKMTKLLVKIKTKQIKSVDLDQKMIQDVFKEMQYMSHRGSPKVMKVVEDFVEGKIQLKHAAYQAYTLAKQKEYKDISTELRAIGVYYSGLFKKVGADQSNAQITVAQQAAVALPSAPVASVASVTPSAVDPTANVATPKTKVAKVVQAPAGKTPEFWNKLHNARGKIEFNRIMKTFGVDQVSTAEYVNGFKDAIAFGDVGVNELSKSYLPLAMKYDSFNYLSAVCAKWISEANELNEVIEPLMALDLDSQYRIKNIMFRSSFLREASQFDRITQLTKKMLARHDKSFDVSNKLVLVDMFNNMYNSMEQFTLIERLKLLKVLPGISANRTGEIRRMISQTLNIVLPQWDIAFIDKSVWDKLDSDVRKTIDKFDLLERLQIKISDANAFETELQKVVDSDTLLFFVRYTVAPLTSQNTDNKLNDQQSEQLQNHLLNTFDKFTDASVAFERVYDHLAAGIQRDKFKTEFFTKNLNVKLAKFKADSAAAESLAYAVRDITKYGIGLDLKNALREVESNLIGLRTGTNSYISYSLSELYKYVDSDFINKYLPKAINSYSRWSYETFAYIENQLLQKETADKIFEAFASTGFVYHSGLDYVLNTILNKEEFGAWMASFIKNKKLSVTQQSPVIKYMLKKFKDFEPTQAQLENSITLDEVANNLTQYKRNPKVMEFFGKKFLEEVMDPSSTTDFEAMISRVIRNDEGILRSLITDETTDEQISAILQKTMGLLGADKTTKWDNKTWASVVKESYGIDLKHATLLFQAMGSRVLSVPGGEQAVEKLAEILMLPSKIKKEFRESVITDVASLFTNADINPDTEKAFSKFEKKTQKLLATNFAMAQFAGGAVDEINNEAIVKPRSKLPAKGALKILKLNQVSIPTSSLSFSKTRGKDLTLQDIKDAATNLAQSFKLEKQAITQIEHSPEELEKLSVVYNRYNRYKHGGIAVRINKVFNVNVSSQQLGWKEFLDESQQAIKNGGYYHKFPQFHGTASLPASMILRYGFSVIDEKLARDAGIKYAGRMLGDGIYSSNVLDKVAQYINDDAPTGVSRRRGAVGYIFEMETHGSQWGRSCNEAGANFASGGTGEFSRERGGLVSPEWAWKYANKQCKIKRCFEIELINKDEMDRLVNKHQDVMEATGFTTFKEYLLTEAKSTQLNKIKSYAQFTFMDNFVPVGNGKYIDLNEESESSLRLPTGTIVDHGRYGVTIMFRHTEDINIRLLYGSDIESNEAVRRLYEKLLKKKV